MWSFNADVQKERLASAVQIGTRIVQLPDGILVHHEIQQRRIGAGAVLWDVLCAVRLFVRAATLLTRPHTHDHTRTTTHVHHTTHAPWHLSLFLRAATATTDCTCLGFLLRTTVPATHDHSAGCRCWHALCSSVALTCPIGHK
eukprot:m.1300197 g.1300197  ORF g.1300197 m.1300197 type:complete len:143 (+) comp24802_c1_seq8:3288-3716(+)